MREDRNTNDAGNKIGEINIDRVEIIIMMVGKFNWNYCFLKKIFTWNYIKKEKSKDNKQLKFKMSKIVSLKGADASSLTMDAFSSSEIVVTIYKKFL